MRSMLNDIAPIILWFRRDLRLEDNLALHAAVAGNNPVICIYIREHSDRYAGALGAAQAWWLHHSLIALNASLDARGTTLLLRSGEPTEVIRHLVAETGAQAVFWNRRYDASGMACDTVVKARLRESGLQAESFAGFLMHDPTRLLTKQGNHYQVFTPFWKAFEAQFHPHDPLPAPEQIKPIADFPAGDSLHDWNLLPANPDWSKGFSGLWHPGEQGGLSRLDDFLEGGIGGYK